MFVEMVGVVCSVCGDGGCRVVFVEMVGVVFVEVVSAVCGVFGDGECGVVFVEMVGVVFSF